MAMAPDIQSTEDYSAATSLSAAQLMSLVRGLQPVDGLGFVIFGIIAPSTIYPDVANNERYKKYLYCDLTNNKLYRYDVAEATDWKEIGSIAVNSASQITNLVITLNKLNQDGATTNQVIAWNGTNWDNANTIDTIANGAIAVAKLDTSGAEGSTLQTVGGTKVWTTIANLATAVMSAVSSFDIAKLSGKVNKGVLATDSGGTSSWQTWATFFDTFIDNNVIRLKKLAQEAATTLQVISWDGSNWVPTTPIFSKYYDSVNPGGLPALLGSEFIFDMTAEFGASVIPKYKSAVIFCLSADAGFLVGDELDVNSISCSGSTANRVPFTVRLTTTGATSKLYVSFLGITTLGAAIQACQPGTPGTLVSLDPTKWSVRARAAN